MRLPPLGLALACVFAAGATTAPAEVRLGPAPAAPNEEAPPTLPPAPFALGPMGSGMSLAQAALLGAFHGLPAAPPVAVTSGLNLREGADPATAAHRARKRAQEEVLRKEAHDREGRHH